MGSVRIAGIRFIAHPQDHLPPHIHAVTGSGVVFIELLGNGNVGLDKRKTATGGAKNSDVRKALNAAASRYDLLVELWEKAR
jgi:hypothetical protein